MKVGELYKLEKDLTGYLFAEPPADPLSSVSTHVQLQKDLVVELVKWNSNYVWFWVPTLSGYIYTYSFTREPVWLTREPVWLTKISK